MLGVLAGTPCILDANINLALWPSGSWKAAWQKFRFRKKTNAVWCEELANKNDVVADNILTSNTGRCWDPMAKLWTVQHQLKDTTHIRLCSNPWAVWAGYGTLERRAHWSQSGGEADALADDEVRINGRCCFKKLGYGTVSRLRQGLPTAYSTDLVTFPVALPLIREVFPTSILWKSVGGGDYRESETAEGVFTESWWALAKSTRSRGSWKDCSLRH